MQEVLLHSRGMRPHVLNNDVHALFDEPGRRLEGVGRRWERVAEGWETVGERWERVGERWERVGERWETVGEGWERVEKGWERVGKGWERVGEGRETERGKKEKRKEEENSTWHNQNQSAFVWSVVRGSLICAPGEGLCYCPCAQGAISTMRPPPPQPLAPKLSKEFVVRPLPPARTLGSKFQTNKQTQDAFMDHMFPSAYTSHRITRCTWFVRWQGLLNNSCVGSGCLVLMMIGPRGQHADWWSAHPRITHRRQLVINNPFLQKQVIRPKFQKFFFNIIQYHTIAQVQKKWVLQNNRTKACLT